MTLHIIKLFVGLDTLPELAAWQAKCLEDRRKAKVPIELYHVTRSTPKRAAELLDGGSIYWILKGRVVVRQRLLELRPVRKGDVEHCAIIFDKELVTVEPRARRPFQGWRYLEEKDAPRDIGRYGVDGDLPESMRLELAALGLL